MAAPLTLEQWNTIVNLTNVDMCSEDAGLGKVPMAGEGTILTRAMVSHVEARIKLRRRYNFNAIEGDHFALIPATSFAFPSIRETWSRSDCTSIVRALSETLWPWGTLRSSVEGETYRVSVSASAGIQVGVAGWSPQYAQVRVYRIMEEGANIMVAENLALSAEGKLQADCSKTWSFPMPVPWDRIYIPQLMLMSGQAALA